ncbi:hypothetical protein A2814_01635 [Candidatus Nomurabacteria bacterium RIFCSPHIGHO2_01_FULL_38_19]|uniref:Uncharacterized protein n=1 Tax=Candidatus Nomurabacteria bacterium RIFCSPHIGHO2_01_FULL_38_19 TaxID=1801732 RepID=A0A1F6UUT5_9BACT|nr:MAG: hypothetical protein A2814_01635 [Candidatus Nomurabacteria bacterium RIFCSPHIGHO2_01_FULL_38_19]
MTIEQIDPTKKLSALETITGNKIINPELAVLKEELADVYREMKLVVDDDERPGESEAVGEVPHSYVWKDDKLVNVIVPEVKHGYGKLGRLLQNQAQQVYSSAEEARRKNLPVGKPDQFIIDAYNNNSEVKKILDDIDALWKKTAELQENVEQIKTAKQELYQDPNAINTFLESIGHDKKVPTDYSFSAEISELKTLPAQNTDIVKLSEHAIRLRDFMEAFDGLKLTREQEKDYGVDLAAIAKNIGKVTQEISRLTFSSDARSDAVKKILLEGKISRRYYEESIGGNLYLYEIVRSE